MAALMVFWALAVFMGFSLNWSAGISLILIFVILQILSKEYNHLKITSLSYPKFRPIILIGSLIILIVSGKICIDQIIILAKQLNIAETILGYFLLALGTSLPELITTWTALKKKEGELALGSVLGSNIFNLLFIFSISTFINPVELSAFKIDLVFLTGITLIVYIFAITGKKYSFSKKEGISLFLLYLTFIAFQAFKS
jgi:cation:H+ antiporter